MTINDGYGDVVEVEDPLPDHEQYLTKVALGVVRAHDPRFQDTLQEGRIEFWRSYRALSDKTDTTRFRFSMNRARWRMRHVVYRDEPYVGHAPMTGRPEVKPSLSLDQPVSGGDQSITVGDLLAEVALEEIEEAYHQGVIVQAINALPVEHREYVYRRFWLGYTASEIAGQFGISRDRVYSRWHQTIRPALARELKHLAGVGS